MSDWITARGEVPDGDTNLAPEARRGHVSTAVGSGGHEIRTDGNGNSHVIHHKNQEYTHGADQGYQGSIIGTARTEGGGLIHNRAVTPTDRITLPNGMTTSIAAAVNIGMLTRNTDGSYADVQTPETLKNPAQAVPFGQAQGDPEDALEDAPEDAAPAFTIGDAGEEAMTALVETVSQGDMIKATDEILRLGGVSENTLARMAGHAGVEPDVMAAQIEAAHGGFYETATAHLAAHGVVNEDGFQTYLSDNPQQMQKLLEASRGLMSSSDANVTNGLTDVATAFVENGDLYMAQEVKDALDEAGFDYEAGANGRILVKIDGYPVPWNVAVRQGLIKFL
ncbi:hypothetical protein [Sulfitobacter dubius]|uniref:hypothetical protein n=1 Tax=Sulfitobacter dubius TaxID=218673 RepID=UPI0022B05A21|nr:hypothetical protein [Sulfitobacter dubius]MCZ4367545.1 hypothetical protein [Sulfitobacter dubius]